MSEIMHNGRRFEVLDIDDLDHEGDGEYSGYVRLRDRGYRAPARLVVTVKSYRSSWFVYLRQNGSDKLVSEFKPLDALTSSGLAFPNPRFLAQALVNEIKRLNNGNVEVIWE